uniref:Uncharacterized protein n=1 Tax=Eufriesea mexicana TaxID=516756 RepID=A0A310S9C0_9HYME
MYKALSDETRKEKPMMSQRRRENLMVQGVGSPVPTAGTRMRKPARKRFYPMTEALDQWNTWLIQG